MDDESICFLCDKQLLAEETVTVTRGLDTIRKCSVQRRDRIAERLTGLSSINVHTICRKNYTRQSTIVSVLHPSPLAIQVQQMIQHCVTLRCLPSSLYRQQCTILADLNMFFQSGSKSVPQHKTMLIVMQQGQITTCMHLNPSNSSFIIFPLLKRHP